jgi:hypothetical protein
MWRRTFGGWWVLEQIQEKLEKHPGCAFVEPELEAVRNKRAAGVAWSLASEVSLCLLAHLRHKPDLYGKILPKFKAFKPPCPHSASHLEHKYIKTLRNRFLVAEGRG